MSTRERRASITRTMLDALDKTWKASDDKGDILDPETRLGILRGGCNAFLSGDFDPMGDGVSLGLAFLTWAREVMILSGYELIIRTVEPQEKQPS